MTDLTLQSDTLTAVFDGKTGALKRLKSNLTGWDIIRRPELALSFKLQVPVPGHANNLVFGHEHAAREIRLAPDGKALTIVWERLNSQYAADLDIRIAARVAIGPEGLVFSAEIRNRSPYVVEGVAFPCVADLRPSTSDMSLDRVSVTANGLESLNLYPHFHNTGGYWGTHHPIENCASNSGRNFVLLQEKDQGLYMACLDTTRPHFTAWWFEQTPGVLDSYTNLMPMEYEELGGKPCAIELMIQQLMFIRPGETRAMSPIGFRAYKGQWQQGFDEYRAWRKTWHRTGRKPAWFEDVHSWLQIQIYSAGDEKTFAYKDLPDIARDCLKHGIKAIQLTGWAEGGQDRGNPSHSIEPALGTLEELKQAIAECEAMGVKIILFTKWTWWDNTRPDYKTEGIKHVAKDPFGNVYPHNGYRYNTWAQLAGVDSWRLVVTCTASPAWRKIALDEFRKVLDTGAPGMLFDECQHHFCTSYCFDPTHDHEQPAYLYKYDVPFAQEMKAVAQEVNPEFLFAGELCADQQMQEYHVMYTRFGKGHVPAYRYMDPRMEIMMAVTGFDDRNQLNKCLEYRYIISYEPYHFKGRPSDAPLTMAYGRKVDDLRRRYRSFLWDGEFRSHIGAAVELDGKPIKEFSVYEERAGGKRAVVVCNLDAKKAVKAAVKLEGRAGASLKVAFPDKPDAVAVDGEVEIPPRSVAIVMEG